MRFYLSNIQMPSLYTNAMLHILMNLKVSPSMNSVSGIMSRVTTTKGVGPVGQNHM